MQPDTASFALRTVPETQVDRMLVVTDAGLHRADMLETAKASLEAHGFAVGIREADLAPMAADLRLYRQAF